MKIQWHVVIIENYLEEQKALNEIDRQQMDLRSMMN